MIKFSQRLKELRTEKKLSIRAIAKLLDMPFTTYNNYEQGTREPSLETLVLLCDFFNVPADYLLGRVDEY